MVAATETHMPSFTYDEENRSTVLTYENGQAVTYIYDALERIQKRKVGAEGSEVETTYTYVPGLNGATTPLIQTISQNGVTLTYAYDDNGNITSVSDGTKTVSYVYDGLGQLIRVNDPTDPTANTSDIANGTTWVFTYDLSGNILTKTAYHHTTGAVGETVESHTYSYGATTINGITYGTNNWKDQLAAIDGVGITYDEVGNPTNDGTWTYTWQHGKQLQQMQKTEAGVITTVQFEYNEDGLRTKKTVTVGNDTVMTEYVLHGKNIVHMTRGSDNLHFYYDAQGKPAEVIFNGIAYGYLYNLQGDVVALVNGSGMKVVEYTFDAWGKPTSKTGSLASTLGAVQPFRYRGYVLDEETGLYYLRSRYYRSERGRFICADAQIERNLYCYCKDAPVSCADFDGFDTIYVIYYHFNGSKTSLYEEAYHNPYLDPEDIVTFIPVRTSDDFVRAINRITDGKDVYLYLHGGEGYLQFAEERDRLYASETSGYRTIQEALSLSEVSISGEVYNFSCSGAKYDGSNRSVASELARITNAPVCACEEGVSFRSQFDFLRPNWYARVKTEKANSDIPHWYRFTYDSILDAITKTEIQLPNRNILR